MSACARVLEMAIQGGLKTRCPTGRVGSTPTPGTVAQRYVASAARSNWARTSPVTGFAWPGPDGRRLHRRQLADACARLLGVVVERPVRDARGALAPGLRVERVERVADEREPVRLRHRPIRPGAWPGKATTLKPAMSSPSETVPSIFTGPPSQLFRKRGIAAARKPVELREIEVVLAAVALRRPRPRRGGRRPARRGPARPRGDRRDRGRARSRLIPRGRRRRTRSRSSSPGCRRRRRSPRPRPRSDRRS